MRTEIEIRARISSPAAVEAELLRRGFRHTGRVQQVDTMIDLPDASLFRSGRKLRLRIEGPSAELTYKGFFEGDDTASRRVELTVSVGVDQARTLLSIFEALGYPVCFRIPKDRTSFMMRDVKVVLDEWPIIGTLMEIEGPESDSKLLAQQICPNVAFANYRLKDLFRQRENETGKSLAELQRDYESSSGEQLGRLDLLLE